MSCRILVVDDNPLSVQLVSNQLVPAGYEVYTAQSGSEALEKADQVQPDLIILDVMMPVMDGYEVCARLRRMPSTSRVPIMMLSAFDSGENRILCFQVGADDFMRKPFKMDELHARVKTLLQPSTESSNPPSGES